MNCKNDSEVIQGKFKGCSNFIICKKCKKLKKNILTLLTVFNGNFLTVIK